jgi:hypothetical protein
MSNHSSIERTEPGESWRDRVGSIVLDPNDPHGQPLPTPADRRWLHLIESRLAVSAGTPELRQLAADLHAYLNETCVHHWLYSEGDDMFAPHEQCLWCSAVEFAGDAAGEATGTPQ